MDSDHDDLRSRSGRYSDGYALRIPPVSSAGRIGVELAHPGNAAIHALADKILANDPVNHPKHYTSHPSGIECIQIVEHLGFCIGNAIKYLFRCDLKKDAIEDLKKARWYIEREITRRERLKAPADPVYLGGTGGPG